MLTSRETWPKASRWNDFCLIDQRPDKENVSLEPPGTKLPDKVVADAKPFLIVGPMAGG